MGKDQDFSQSSKLSQKDRKGAVLAQKKKKTALRVATVHAKEGFEKKKRRREARQGGLARSANPGRKKQNRLRRWGGQRITVGRNQRSGPLIVVGLGGNPAPQKKTKNASQRVQNRLREGDGQETFLIGDKLLAGTNEKITPTQTG